MSGYGTLYVIHGSVYTRLFTLLEGTQRVNAYVLIPIF